MVDGSSRDHPLRDDPRIVPSDEHAEALAEAEARAKTGGRPSDVRNTRTYLRMWARLIDDIGSYREYGSDDYHHHLGNRMMLHRVLVALREQGHQDVLAWLQGEVDRLDQAFLERSTYDVEGLILRKEKSNPAYWFMRRLPQDDNVVDHLRMIQPKNKHVDDR